MIVQSVKFQAHLQRGSIGLEEMKRLIVAYAKCGDFKEVKKLAIEENLLGKSSGRSIEDALYAFRRRFLSDSGLPPAELVARILQAPIPDAAKIQTLFPYFVVTDPLIERCYRGLVLSRLNDYKPQLTSQEVKNYLIELSVDHPELAKWSEKLKDRWSIGFLTLMRRFGLMERHPKRDLRKMWLLPEPFAFFLLWFVEREGTFWSAINQPLWELLQLSDRRKEELLIEGQLRQWWEYRRSGSIVSFQPKFANLREWLEDGLV